MMNILRTMVRATVLVMASVFAMTVSAASRPKILVTFPTDGYFEMMGESVTLGLKAARELMPELDRRYEFVDVPTKGDIKSMSEDIQQAIKDHKPFAIVGGISSLHAFAIGDLAEKNGVYYIAPYATNPKVTEAKKYVYTTCFDDRFQAEALAAFVVKKSKKKRVAMISQAAEPYSVYLSQAFSEKVKQLGGEIVLSLTVSEGQPLPAADKAKILELKPDYVFIPIYQKSVAVMLKQFMSEKNANLTFLGSDAWAGGLTISGTFKEGLSPMKAYSVEHWVSSHTTALGKKVLDHLAQKQKAGEEQGYARMDSSGMALGFDSALLLLQAAENKKAKVGRSPFDGLRFEGATGRFDYRAGHAPRKTLYILESDMNGVRYFDKISEL